MVNKMKACPSCECDAGRIISAVIVPEANKSYAYFCDVCKYWSDYIFESEDEAINAWNGECIFAEEFEDEDDPVIERHIAWDLGDGEKGEADWYLDDEERGRR